MTICDITKKIVEKQKESNTIGLKVDIIGMYSAFYEQHKKLYGSYKPYINASGNSYTELMQGRYEWIFSKIDQVIESKQKYNLY